MTTKELQEAMKDIRRSVEYLNDQLQIAVRHEAAITAALWDNPPPACGASCKSALAIRTLLTEVSPAADALLQIVEEIHKLDGLKEFEDRDLLVPLRASVKVFEDLIVRARRRA